MTRSARTAPLQVLLQSIDSALDGITKSKAISDEDAHSARKLLKKARAALRLLRPTIGDVVYRRENTALRNASRSISRLRDAKAQAEIVASLRKRPEAVGERMARVGEQGARAARAPAEHAARNVASRARRDTPDERVTATIERSEAPRSRSERRRRKPAQNLSAIAQGIRRRETSSWDGGTA
jgi:hypothetical protein